MSLSRKSDPSFFSTRGRYYIEYASSVLDQILVYLVLHVKDMSFDSDKQDVNGVTDQEHKTRHLRLHLSEVLLSRAPLSQNKQVHVFSASH